MPDYNAAEIVGKTLIAAQPVAIKRLAESNAPTVFTVATGQPVGVVDTYMSPGINRSTLWWGFLDSSGRAYYSQHLPGMYNIQSLVNQGTQTTLQKIQAEQKENESLKDTLERNFKYLIGIGAVVWLAGTFIKSRGRKK